MKPSDTGIIRAIRDLTAELGYPPTFRQTGTRVGLLSSSSIQRRLYQMKARGLVEFEEGKSRTLRVVES